MLASIDEDTRRKRRAFMFTPQPVSMAFRASVQPPSWRFGSTPVPPVAAPPPPVAPSTPPGMRPTPGAPAPFSPPKAPSTPPPPPPPPPPAGPSPPPGPSSGPTAAQAAQEAREQAGRARAQAQSGGRFEKVERILQQDPLDYYAILGLSRDATMIQIKKAFMILARDIHTDKFGGQITREQQTQVEAAVKMVNNAGDILRNVNLKEIYDTSRSAEEFLNRVRDFEAKETRDAQQAADAQARAEAQAAAAAAQAAAEEAERAAEQAAAASAAPSDEPWYRARNIAARQEEYRAQRRTPQMDAGRSAAAMRDRATERQRDKRAAAQNQARQQAPRAGDAYLAHLAMRSIEAQQAAVDVPRFSVGSGGSAPQLDTGRVRGAGAKFNYGRPSGFGRGPERQSRAYRAYSQAEARDQAVQKARLQEVKS